MSALMAVVAVGCALAGTWQISRFHESVRDNDALKANAHAVAVPLTTGLVPLVGSAPAPSRTAIRYRTITASGRYLAGAPDFVSDEYLHGTRGYYVLGALRTARAVLLVVRGFVAEDGSGAPPATITAPPEGLVRITGRLQTADTKSDAAGRLSTGEIDSINPHEQASRLRTPVFETYVTLNAHQPGTSGVRVLPKPDLSNPAGGAYEGQHFAYIIQWYLFALIALAAPFAIGRSEVRDARRRFLGIDPATDQFDDQHRWQLGAGGEADDVPAAGVAATGGVARKSGDALVRQGARTPQQWRHAARLADRYGRSLGVSPAPTTDEQPLEGRASSGSAAGGRGRNVAGGSNSPDRAVVPSSATDPHRSEDDAYHASYNDYLWQLALADGVPPPVNVAEQGEAASTPLTPVEPRRELPPA